MSVGAIGEHQVGPPVWSGLPAPEREDLRDEWVEFLEDETAVILRRGARRAPRSATPPSIPAERTGGRAPSGGGDAARRARCAGSGSALVEHALHEAQLAGFETVQLDWRSTNLLASRFWPQRGFRPTHLRLRRDVQPTA